jgi:hypothetical protein
MDPMVGRQCGEGLVPYGSGCVPVNACVALDGGTAITTLDGAVVDPVPGIDAELGVGLDAGETVDGETYDGEELAVDAAGDEAGLASGSDAAPKSDASAKTDLVLPDTKKTDTSSSLARDTQDAAIDAPMLSPDANLPDTRGSSKDAYIDTRDAAAKPDAVAASDVHRDTKDAYLGCLGCQDAADAPGSDAHDDATDAPGSDASAVIVVDDAGEAGLSCASPTVPCTDQCADLMTDEKNCGRCGKSCGFLICISGECQNCPTGKTACNGDCVDLQSDPNNCGACSTACEGAACRFGVCKETTAGHVFVIGHDFRNTNEDIDKILVNAVFASTSADPLQLAHYSTSANSSSLRGANTAIATGATTLGRTYVRNAVNTTNIVAQLTEADVFLVYGLENATDPTLEQLATDWAGPLALFVHTGGILIVLDGDYPGNSGTVTLLSQAGILDIQRAGSATNGQCEVAAPSDVLAVDVATPYVCPLNSTTFSTTDGNAVVESNGLPVVVHKAF